MGKIPPTTLTDSVGASIGPATTEVQPCTALYNATYAAPKYRNPWLKLILEVSPPIISSIRASKLFNPLSAASVIIIGITFPSTIESTMTLIVAMYNRKLYIKYKILNE